jgi:hypothetical protein
MPSSRDLKLRALLFNKYRNKDMCGLMAGKPEASAIIERHADSKKKRNYKY